MKSYRFWILLFAISITVGVASTQSHARTWQDAQTPIGNVDTAQEQGAELSAEAKAFQDLQKQIQANQNRIDSLFRTLPIGFPEKRNISKREIERLTALNAALKKEVFSKAKAAFQSSEEPSAQSTMIVQKRLSRMLRPRGADDSFDPETALGLIAMMKEKFPENPTLLELEFLANYALERFENASLSLEKLEAVTRTDLVVAKQELAATIEKYQQELMIRRLESNTNDLPKVRLVTTEGDIVVELFENHAPNTVANFIHLVRDQKFYDGKLFHLVKPGEYAMTGSPTGNGMGDAGYRIPCECYGEKIRSHFRGTLTMMAPERDRGGSQFFIMQQPNPHTFDGKYTAFGRVTEGMDVVLKLNNVDMTSSMASTAGVSKIIRAEVMRARSHTYMPEKITNNPAGFTSFNSPLSVGAGSGNSAGRNEDGADRSDSFNLLLPSGGNDK